MDVIKRIMKALLALNHRMVLTLMNFLQTCIFWPHSVLLNICCVLTVAQDKILILLPNIANSFTFPFSGILMRVMPRVFASFIMRMNRYTDHNLWDGVVKDNFSHILEVIPQLIPQKRSLQNFDELSIKRTILLKKCRKEDGKVIEKGVLLLKFTTTFDFFYRAINIEKLLEDYFIVLEPSWAGYCDPSILQWCRFPDHRIIVEASEKKDFLFLETLQSNLTPVSFGSSDWVDFRIFKPIAGIDKVYDSIYVSNYSRGKRNYLYFKAIADIDDPHYRCAVVFGTWGGRGKKIILELIKFYGIEKNIDIYENLSQSELNLLLNKSKVNLLLSKKEGSNRSVFEGFFANVPGIVLQNNIGMNKDYINSCTGMLVSERDISNALIQFQKEWKKYSPRNWAMEHISPIVTTQKLNTLLKKNSDDNGLRWTVDIVPKVNCPEADYFNDSDRGKLDLAGEILKKYMK